MKRRLFSIGFLSALVAACRNRLMGGYVEPGNTAAPDCAANNPQNQVTVDGQCLPEKPASPDNPAAPFTPAMPPTKSGTLTGLRVTLDVGHGVAKESRDGWDPGAQNPGQRLVEYELNRTEAFLLAENLRNKGSTVRVNDYKRGSPQLTLTQKGNAAGDCHIFVSVHHNAVGSSSVQGTEVLYDTRGSYSDKELAAIIQKHLMQNIWQNTSGIKNRGARAQRLGVLGGVPKAVRARVLTEAYFLTSSDATKTSTQLWSVGAAKGIARGIEEFWGQKSMSLYSAEEEWPATPFPEDPDELGLYENH
jgi:N-acetylmuramoyl-L-alanine amidase